MQEYHYSTICDNFPWLGHWDTFPASTVLPPQGFTEVPIVVPNLSVLKDCLCFSLNLQICDHLNDLEFHFLPLCISEKSDTLLLTNNLESQAILYNWRNNSAERIDKHWFHRMNYVESYLISIQFSKLVLISSWILQALKFVTRCNFFLLFLLVYDTMKLNFENFSKDEWMMIGFCFFEQNDDRLFHQGSLCFYAFWYSKLN